MKIKNISGKEYELLGYIFEIDEDIPLGELGTNQQLKTYSGEVLMAVVNNEVAVMYSDDTIMEDIGRIAELLQNGVLTSEVTISGTVNTDTTQYNDMYYYNSVVMNMEAGDIRTIKFKGYLDNVYLKSLKGIGTFQIVKPKMNEVLVNNLSEFMFDAKYQIKDPVIQMIANTTATVEIFLDGLYPEDAEQSKEDYLSEIYNKENIDVIEPIDNNDIVFDVELDPTTLGIGYAKESIKGDIGIASNFVDSFTTNTSIEFNPGFTIGNGVPFTLGVTFNIDETTTSSMYVVYKKNEYAIKISNDYAYVYIGDKYTRTGKLTRGVSHNIIVTYDGSSKYAYVYIDGVFSSTIEGPIKIHNYGSTLYIGSGSNGTSYNFIGNISRVFGLNYSVTGSNIENIYEVYGQIKSTTDTVSGVLHRFYSTGTRGTEHIFDADEFRSVEARYASNEYLLYSEVTDNIDSTKSTWENLTTTTNYISIVTTKYVAPTSGYYVFDLQGDDAVELSMGNRIIVADYGSHGIQVMKEEEVYLEEGIAYDIKLRHYQGTGGSGFKAQVKVPDSDDFIDILGVIENTKTTNGLIRDITEGTASGADTNNGVQVDDYLSFTGSNELKFYSDSSFNTREFTLRLNVNVKNYKETRLVSIGGDSSWKTWLGIEVKNKTLKIYFNKRSIRINNAISTYKDYQIDLLSDGKYINVYLNGKYKTKVLFDDYDDYRGTNFYINRFPDGSTAGWINDSDFSIKTLEYFNRRLSYNEVLTKYVEGV